LALWSKLTEPGLRAEAEERIATLSAGDDAIALRDRAAFLPGLAARLQWTGQNAVLDRLRSRGLAGPDLKREFIIEMMRLKLDSSIFAHEGRHVLDQIEFRDILSSEELEFRAKLSEVAFCEDPRLCFGSIFNANMGNSSSPHGLANKRVALGILDWMEKHANDVAGLDQARPLLPQFDKLKADQMRNAMRSMDVWAKSE
jgi:hypothetical protein